MEIPFSDQEMRFMLGEIVKQSSISPARILQLLNESNVEPNFNHMLIPNGRTVNQCREAFDRLLGAITPAIPRYAAMNRPGPSNPAKRKSVDIDPLPMSPVPKRRPPGVDIIPGTRNIQPKPASSVPSFPAPPPEPPKKRGRPSKKDLAMRQEGMIRRGEVLAPARPSPRTLSGGEASGTGRPVLQPILAPAPRFDPLVRPSPTSTESLGSSQPSLGLSKSARPAESKFSLYEPHQSPVDRPRESPFLPPPSRPEEFSPYNTQVRTVPPSQTSTLAPADPDGPSQPRDPMVQQPASDR